MKAISNFQVSYIRAIYVTLTSRFPGYDQQYEVDKL